MKTYNVIVRPHTTILQWILTVFSMHAYQTDSWAIVAKTSFFEGGHPDKFVLCA